MSLLDDQILLEKNIENEILRNKIKELDGMISILSNEIYILRHESNIKNNEYIYTLNTTLENFYS